MDLNTIESFERPRTRDALPRPAPGDAWLAGGTWLFSEPQPSLKRLVDLTALGWAPIEMQDDGVFVAATCPVATLEAFAYPSVWRAGPLISQCCHAFLASFKIWNAATVGGNICMALPAGPMISLGAALDATCLLWGPDGPQRTAIAPCELLRGIAFREAVLRRPAAFRRISLQAQGRSGAVVIGTRDEGGAIAITVTAATRRPHRLVLREPVGGDDLARRVDAEIGAAGWYDDIHGRPDWRRHMTIVFIEEIVAELAGAPS
jgi:CO/xanthine dehydrogenase FAD-binding subunit